METLFAGYLDAIIVGLTEHNACTRIEVGSVCGGVEVAAFVMGASLDAYAIPVCLEVQPVDSCPCCGASKSRHSVDDLAGCLDAVRS